MKGELNMSRRLLLAACGVVCAILMLGAQAPVELAKCTGSSSCKACKNCNNCKHCNEDGGDCGVKRNKSERKR